MADCRVGELSSGLGYRLDLKSPGSEHSQNSGDGLKGGILIGPQVDLFHLVAELLADDLTQIIDLHHVFVQV